MTIDDIVNIYLNRDDKNSTLVISNKTLAKTQHNHMKKKTTKSNLYVYG